MSEKDDDYKRYGVTPWSFKQWRAPRYGDQNPTLMNNSVWEWLVRTRHSAYTAADMIGGASTTYSNPGWCFDRFGQSCTTLPDGRKVFIGESTKIITIPISIFITMSLLKILMALSIFTATRKIFFLRPISTPPPWWERKSSLSVLWAIPIPGELALLKWQFWIQTHSPCV